MPRRKGMYRVGCVSHSKEAIYMATYREIQEFIKNNYGYSVNTCWIAHAKEICGLNPRYHTIG